VSNAFFVQSDEKMKKSSRAIVLILVLVAATSVGVVLSKSRSVAGVDDKQQKVESGDANSVISPAQMEMGPHMRMTVMRQLQPGDKERGEAVAQRTREAIEKYRDYRVALRDGYKILLPDVPQKMYHFNNTQYYLEAERQLNPEHPTSLLYEKARDGYKLVGVMFTAPSEATEDELNRRIPLSVASWHQHVNICLPQGDPLQKLFGQGTEFGLDGSITTLEECERAGGQFIPQLFGWMVHLYPYERTTQEMWSVERQMGTGSNHMH
jgi:hypothetical protein